jgi:hypothetical protein
VSQVSVEHDGLIFNLEQVRAIRCVIINHQLASGKISKSDHYGAVDVQPVYVQSPLEILVHHHGREMELGEHTSHHAVHQLNEQGPPRVGFDQLASKD